MESGWGWIIELHKLSKEFEEIREHLYKIGCGDEEIHIFAENELVKLIKEGK